MAKFRYTETVYNYSFTPPSIISELEFHSYKQMLRANPNANIFKETNVKKKNEFIYILLVVGIICFLIGLMTILSAEKSNDAPGWAFALLFGSIFLVLHPIVNTGILKSSINEDRADTERSKYYADLKYLIINSSTYPEFSMKYKAKYGGYAFR
jgi:hypothetical protein